MDEDVGLATLRHLDRELTHGAPDRSPLPHRVENTPREASRGGGGAR